jgi:site-specific recombinase XerD
MTFHVIRSPNLNNAQSPFRVVDEAGREVAWVNRFLDQQRVRCVADATLRSYAHDLLHFLRWWVRAQHTDTIREDAITDSTLLDYIQFQASQQPRPAAASINRRVSIAERVLRLEAPGAVAQSAPAFQHRYWRRSPLGFGRWRPALSQLRVRTPKRMVSPLSVDQVARFWSSFHTSRDLAIVGLMVLHGLRSCEVLALSNDDLLLADSQIRVSGKGNKQRMLPLVPETAQLLQHYLHLERPANCGPILFVSLKGRARGCPMTPAGLRSLFRHHRHTTGVSQANPHRFRHTFATDMIRAGVSLPALMQLMGHAQIHTTLVYVRLTAQDVYQQYARAVAHQLRHVPPQQS